MGGVSVLQGKTKPFGERYLAGGWWASWAASWICWSSWGPDRQAADEWSRWAWAEWWRCSGSGRCSSTVACRNTCTSQPEVCRDSVQKWVLTMYKYLVAPLWYIFPAALIYLSDSFNFSLPIPVYYTYYIVITYLFAFKTIKSNFIIVAVKNRAI